MIEYDLTKIKGIVFDVDGVLSPSTVPLSPTGEPLRMVSVKDGYAIQHAVKHGLRIAILSGADTQAIRVRFSGLGVQDLMLAAARKLPVFEQWLADNKLEREEVIFVGDDIPDLPVMRAAGLAVAPADAAPEIKAICTYISHKDGGKGCCRDILEQILKAQDLWMHNSTAFGW
ncbi:MAG: HAD hydrolase family protein [Muribaculaceae bacterium]|nr:HAD hydrolase family protein [Muribaculaceae bacterium]